MSPLPTSKRCPDLWMGNFRATSSSLVEDGRVDGVGVMSNRLGQGLILLVRGIGSGCDVALPLSSFHNNLLPRLGLKPGLYADVASCASTSRMDGSSSVAPTIFVDSNRMVPEVQIAGQSPRSRHSWSRRALQSLPCGAPGSSSHHESR